jgi:hypothetical protein
MGPLTNKIDVDVTMNMNRGMPDGNSTLHTTGDNDNDNAVNHKAEFKDKDLDMNAVLESLEVKPLLGGLSNELFIVQQRVMSISMRSNTSCSGSSSSSSNNNDYCNDDNDDDHSNDPNHTRSVLVHIRPTEHSTSNSNQFGTFIHSKLPSQLAIREKKKKKPVLGNLRSSSTFYNLHNNCFD